MTINYIKIDISVHECIDLFYVLASLATVTRITSSNTIKAPFTQLNSNDLSKMLSFMLCNVIES